MVFKELISKIFRTISKQVLGTPAKQEIPLRGILKRKLSTTECSPPKRLKCIPGQPAQNLENISNENNSLESSANSLNNSTKLRINEEHKPARIKDKKLSRKNSRNKITAVRIKETHKPGKIKDKTLKRNKKMNSILYKNGTTKNPFMNFLRDFREANTQLSAVESSVVGAKIWKNLNQSKKLPYLEQALFGESFHYHKHQNRRN